MPDSQFDVLGIGNAIVDVLARADEAFLAQHSLVKGTMRLIDEHQARQLYEEMQSGVESSGGSVANTMAGIAALGGRAAFIGRVRNDQLGDIFRHDITAIGVHFSTPAATSGPATAKCLILVTPDAERTMNTYLGASTALGPSDVDPDLVAASKITYLEGYLWDPEEAKKAFIQASGLAHRSGRKVALSLSDPFCVDRHRREFRELVAEEIDILLANEEEIKSLYEVEHFDEALQLVRGECELSVLTRSAAGSVIVNGEETHVINAAPVDEVLDATGAGDLFAAGFLHGYANDFDLVRAARLGARTAAEAISHFGARPETDLKAFIEHL
ncbi:MAG: adenosine kinase [Hyphomicrobiales bacterium]|nr:MAG: adenosine kinase [Hyphomicrobiales bacterium]